MRQTVNEKLHETVGCEGHEGEGKSESSETAKLVNWQTGRMAQI